jgi:hypothetical protein
MSGNAEMCAVIYIFQWWLQWRARIDIGSNSSHRIEIGLDSSPTGSTWDRDTSFYSPHEVIV